MGWPTFGNNTEARRADSEKKKPTSAPKKPSTTVPTGGGADTGSTVDKIKAGESKLSDAIDRDS
jgi:hypothetical protein